MPTWIDSTQKTPYGGVAQIELIRADVFPDPRQSAAYLRHQRSMPIDFDVALPGA